MTAAQQERPHYVARDGEKVSEIARRLKIRATDLVKLNAGYYPGLKAGSTVTARVSSSAESPRSHTMRSKRAQPMAPPEPTNH